MPVCELTAGEAGGETGVSAVTGSRGDTHTREELGHRDQAEWTPCGQLRDITKNDYEERTERSDDCQHGWRENILETA